ncbi:choline transporter-like protein 2 [Plakobranchus ocellatus]|uniref:Choline transporter-like protein n=1 Tax=Plakobranchus ocellatus TaxID=259542 RepID=A0AAV4B311_9GAST|nr:choline transporter-like protein 2 [Plakobranchus ocellatus]
MSRKNSEDDEAVELQKIEVKDAGDEEVQTKVESAQLLHASSNKLAEAPLGAEDVDAIDGRVLREYGEPLQYDPTFKGPIKNRSCTDIICCLMFVICLLVMVAVSIIAYFHGDPYRLVYPTNSQGQICGKGPFKDKPNLFFFDLVTCAKLGPAVVTGCPTPQVCVEKCPSKNYVYVTAARSDLICLSKVDHTISPYKEMTVDELIKKNLCASYYLNSRPILGRCVPKIFSDAIDTSKSLVDSNGNVSLARANGESVTIDHIKNGTLNLLRFFKLKGIAELLFMDVVNSVHIIIACLVVAMILAMIWIVLLRWVTHIMVWLSIILFFCLFAFATGFSFYKYYEVKNMNVTSEYKLPEEFKFELDYVLSMERTWLIFGCTSGTILVIFLLIILTLCGRIRLATNLIAEGSVAVSHMWCVLFWPITPFLLKAGVIIYFVTSTFYIASMGPKEFYNGTSDMADILDRFPCNPEGNSTLSELCGFVMYGGDEYKTPMLIYMLFMFYWLINFVLALEEMALAGAFASYYWAWDKERDIPAWPLAASLYRSLRYHTGSLAFGSLLVSSVQMIVSALEYIDRKLKSSENNVAKFFVKCLKCCSLCLEKILRYINKNAYIMIAVHGRNFCTATKDGFLLVMRNVLR